MIGSIVILKERLRVEAEEGGLPESRFYDIVLSDGTAVGSCSLMLGEVAVRDGGSIGYAVEYPYRGKGFAAAACQEMLHIAAAEGVENLTIACEEGNLASIRVAEKLGAESLGMIELAPGDALYRKGVRRVAGYRIALSRS